MDNNEDKVIYKLIRPMMLTRYKLSFIGILWRFNYSIIALYVQKFTFVITSP